MPRHLLSQPSVRSTTHRRALRFLRPFLSSFSSPMGVVIAGANVHDTKLLEKTIDAIVVERPEPSKKSPQHLCLDKGYDNPTGRAATEQAEYTPHMRRIGEEKLDKKGRKNRKARRWVVERTLGWLSKCGGIRVRYAK